MDSNLPSESSSEKGECSITSKLSNELPKKDDRSCIIKCLGIFCYTCFENNYPHGQGVIQKKGKF